MRKIATIRADVHGGGRGYRLHLYYRPSRSWSGHPGRYLQIVARRPSTGEEEEVADGIKIRKGETAREAAYRAVFCAYSGNSAWDLRME